MTAQILTQARLQELLHYDPITGIFTWRVTRNHKALAGQQAGSISTRGYTDICISGKTYRAHRLAWLYVYGKLPTACIDHIDNTASKSLNKISNLREATHTQNNENKQKYANNKSGYKGVFLSKRDSRWVAQIAKNCKSKHLGCFDTAYEAHLAYEAAAKELFTYYKPE